MNIQVQECYDLIERTYPLSLKACRPRIIDSPPGWDNPKWFSINMASALVTAQAIKDSATANNLVSALLLVKYQVPTYFVTHALAEACWLSTPPLVLPLSAIKWPMPAMLFVLPNSFLTQYVKHHTPFLAVSRAVKGKYPDKLVHDLPAIETPWHVFPSIVTDINRILLWYPRFGNETNLPIDYNGAYDLDKPIQFIKDWPMTCEINDASLPHELITHCDLPTGSPEERELNAKMNVFTISLMLAMTARPALISTGEELRKERTKHGRTKLAMWSPNYIGKTYAILQKPSATGTHASPRMHWRRGHFRHQHFGVGWEQVKIIWIEPTLVNAL